MKRYHVESMTRTYVETNDYDRAVRYCKMHGAEFPCFVRDTVTNTIVARYSPQNTLGSPPNYEIPEWPDIMDMHLSNP